MEHSKDSLIHQSNLQDRYEFIFKDDGYVFTTEAGTEYIVTFLEYGLFSDIPIQVYHFSFYKVNTDKDQSGDIRVRNTILKIIDTFFDEHERAMIAICDTDDGKQKFRQRLFNMWYRPYRNIISKKDAVVNLDDETQTYASLFYRKDDLCVADLERQFDELSELNFYH